MDQQHLENLGMGDIFPGKCQICSVPTKKSCSACSSVYYCSPEHQLQDWKVDKRNCKAYVLQKNDDLGRHYVATRNLNAGIVILKEVPVVCAAARPPPQLESKGIHGETRYCLGCLRFLLDNAVHRCSKCGLPVCSSYCEKIPLHAENECEIFQKLNGKFHCVNFNDLCVIRTCLLKKKNPKAWKTVITLQNKATKTGLSMEMNKNVVQSMLTDIFQISDFVTVEEWILVTNILNTNTSEMTKEFFLPDGSNFTSSLQFLCLEGTFFAHSCAPNCFFDATTGPNMKYTVFTATSVKKGEILTIDYYGSKCYMGTYMRQKLNDQFWCKCRRCKDPSEMGSNLSTFVCSQCKALEMMPTKPTDTSADWKCRACGNVETGGSKIALMDKIFKQTEEMDFYKTGTKPLEDLIEKYSGKILHPYNWVLVYPLVKLLEYLSITTQHQLKKGPLNGIQYQLLVSNAEQLLAITDLITPGISMYRGEFSNRLARVILQQAMFYMGFGILRLKEFQKRLDRAKELFLFSLEFYKKYYVQSIGGNKSKDVIHIEICLECLEEKYNGSPEFVPGFNLAKSDDEIENISQDISQVSVSKKL